MGSGDEGHSHSETRVPVTSLPINAEIDRMDNFIEKCLKEQIAAKKAEQQVQSGSDIASQCDESTSVASSFAPSSFAPSQVAQSEYQASQASQAPQYQFETPFEGTDFYNFDGNVPLDIETRIPIQLGDFWTARESTTFHSRIPVPAKATSQVPDHSLFAFKNRITMVGSTSMELTKASGGEEDLGDVHDHLKDVYQRIKKMLRSQGKVRSSIRFFLFDNRADMSHFTRESRKLLILTLMTARNQTRRRVHQWRRSMLLFEICP